MVNLARDSACSAAPIAISTTDSSALANRRDSIPVRCTIHSSDESMASTISEFGTSRSGR